MPAQIEIPGVDFEELAKQVVAVKVTEALSGGKENAAVQKHGWRGPVR